MSEKAALPESYATLSMLSFRKSNQTSNTHIAFSRLAEFFWVFLGEEGAFQQYFQRTKSAHQSQKLKARLSWIRVRCFEQVKRILPNGGCLDGHLFMVQSKNITSNKSKLFGNSWHFKFLFWRKWVFQSFSNLAEHVCDTKGVL